MSKAPKNIAGQVIVTAFTDGRPIDIRSSVAPLDGLLLLLAAMRGGVLQLQSQQIPAQAQADPVDKPRQFLGPRS